jgi:hypothetical protein
LINICQGNTSLCLTPDIFIPKDELIYFVFDYLNDYKNIDVINDQYLMKKIEDFIKNNLFPIENLVLSDRKILGPRKYNRAEFLSIGISSSNITLNNALEMFCTNQSLINTSDLFAREVCAGYQQAIYLNEYFKSIPNFCPNCTFVDAVDKYYWFDNIIPFLPLWITLIGKRINIWSFYFLNFVVFSWISSYGSTSINSASFKCTQKSCSTINESKITSERC